MNLPRRYRRLLSLEFWRRFSDPREAASLPARLYRVFSMLVRGFFDDTLTIHAASLTFVTLTSLVPLLAVGSAVLKGLGVGQERISGIVNGEWISDMPAAFQEAVDAILQLVDKTNFAALGGIGLVVFVITAVLLLSNIEKSFNLIWGVRTNRGFHRQLMNYTSILVLVPLLLFATASVRATLAAKIYFPTLFGDTAGALASAGLQNALSFLMLWLAFGLLFSFVPNTRVRARPAVMGSFATSLVFIGWMKMFMVMQIGVSSRNAIYGAFAALPVLLFWMYVTWVILLLGVEFTFAIQNAETYALERGGVSPRMRIACALMVLRETAREARDRRRCFDAGGFGRVHRIPMRLLNTVLDLLVRRDYLAPVAKSDASYVLLRTPEDISLRDVVRDLLRDGESGKELRTLAPEDDAVFRSLEKVLDGIDESLGSVTVSDLAAAPPLPQEAAK